MVEWVLEHLVKEWDTAMNTPIIFIFYTLVGICISFIFYTYVMLPRKNDLIALLQEENKKLKSKDGNTQKPVTREEVRTFFESIAPEILQEIDAKQKEIRVDMSILQEIKFIELSERPDFGKYLSFTKEDGSYTWNCVQMTVYYIFPKDALIK
jgi:hypothetical protein